MSQNKSVSAAKTKPQRPAKELVKGLPEHAQFEWKNGCWYVYFPYCFRVDGKRKQERNYIGTFQNDQLVFEPNYYFKTAKPVFEKRPLERWRDPTMRKLLMEKQLPKAETTAKKPEEKLDPDVEQDVQLSVGATALAVSILYSTGMIKVIGSVLSGNAKQTMTCANLAVHSAITSDKTYLAEQESELQKFIGTGCPSSPRASEFFKDIGEGQSLSVSMSKACAEQLADGELVALDGTRIDSCSRNIDISATGKRKDGTYGKQINVSLLVNVRTGSPICYRMYGGNVSDISTLTDLQQVWTDAGIGAKSPIILMDRGYPDKKLFLSMNNNGYKFLIGARTSMKEIKHVIDEYNCEFYDQQTYQSHQHCYGVKHTSRLKQDGEEMNLHAYVFRSPYKEMSETDALNDRLREIQEKWQNGELLSKDDAKLLYLFDDPVRGRPLVINQGMLSEECYRKGYFGLIGNVDTSLGDALTKYRLRNEVEVSFKLMFQHLLKTTRVHSTEALEGLMMTSFVGLSILNYMRAHMNETIINDRAKDMGVGSTIGKLWTIREIFSELRRIKIAYNKDGQPRLINVVKRDKDLVAALGFPGLFDSAEKVARLLSGKYLSEYLAVA